MSIRTNVGFHWIRRFWKIMESFWPINEITSYLQRHNFDRRTNEGTPRLLCDGVTRGSFKLILFTSSSELTNETFWRGCEDYSQVNNLSCLWNQGCLQNVLELFFKSRLISRLNSWVALKIKVDIKMRQNPHFYPTQCKNGKMEPIF